MGIIELVDRNYYSVSILEEVCQVRAWLQERDYYAIIDERARTVGIVIREDLSADGLPELLIDCRTDKPVVRPDQTALEICALMRQVGYQHLPVFSEDEFLGVISLSVLEGL